MFGCNLKDGDSAERKAALENLMRKGGKVVRKLWDYFRFTLGQSKKELSLKKFLVILLDAIKRNPSQVILFEKFKLSAKDVTAVDAITKASTEILATYEKLCFKRAGTWFNKINGFATGKVPMAYTIEDMHHEALTVACKLIYLFSQEFKFSTYLTVAIDNRMKRLVNCNSLLSQMSEEHISLQKRYAEMRSSHPEATPDEIAHLMGLSSEDFHALHSMSRGCYVSSDVLTGEEVKTIDELVVDKTTAQDSDTTLSVFGVVQLNDNLLKVAKAWMSDGSYGWQNRLAKGWINPKTGMPYSRMQISHWLDEIKRKLQGTGIMQLKEAG